MKLGSGPNLWKYIVFLCNVIFHLAISENIFNLCSMKRKKYGMFVAIPAPLNCSKTQETEIKSERVHIYTRAYYEVNGVSCSAVNRTICTNAFLRFSLKITRDETKTFNISENDCRMLAEKRSLNGIKLQRISNSVWLSREPIEYSYGWLGTRCNSVINYRIEYGPLHFLDGLRNSEKCVPQSGICFTPTETIIWKAEDTQQCPYRHIGNHIAHFTQKMITISDLQSVFLITNSSENLNISKCGFSKPIYTENDLIIDLHLPNKSNSFNRIQKQNGRALFVEKADDEISIKDGENPKLQYLWNMVNKRENERQKQWLYRLCMENNDKLAMVRWISSFKPTAGARILLGRNDIKAENIGNLLMVYPCHQIKADRIFENHRVKDKCYQDLPVQIGRFILFSQSHSRDLKSSSKIIDCDLLSTNKVMTKMNAIFDSKLNDEKSEKIIFRAHRLPHIFDEFVYRTLEKLHRQTEPHRAIENSNDAMDTQETKSNSDDVAQGLGITIDEATTHIQTEFNEIIKKWVQTISLIILGVIITMSLIILIKLLFCIRCFMKCCSKRNSKRKVRIVKICEKNGKASIEKCNRYQKV